MRVRSGILVTVLALLVTVTGCGGDDGKKAEGKKTPTSAQTRLATPSADLSELTVPCAEFAQAAAKIADAQRDLYTGGSPAAIKALSTELDALKDGAPAKVRRAIDDLTDAFAKAATLMEQPSTQVQAELAELGPKLAQAGQELSGYIVSKCGS